MSPEQERSIEALSLQHGFAAEREVRLVDTPGGLYAVEHNGDVIELAPQWKVTGYRRFMADTYGVGATP
jgi:hypothetical protein